MTNTDGSDPDIEWAKLIFEFKPTEHMFLARTTLEAGKPVWSKGEVVKLQSIPLSPAAAVLNYAQAAFEGLKAIRTPHGKVVLFRPQENARRFSRSAGKLVMPPYPVPWFLEAVEDLVRAEAKFVPPYHEPDWPDDCPAGSRSLYIRPVMIGSGPMLGVKPAHEYTFYIFVSPVGLFKTVGELVVLDSTHRAPAYGIGDVKAAANYPATLLPAKLAARQDAVDVLYLDARRDAYIEEVGSSNFFAILKDGTLVTPRTGSILPGITRDSVMTIARELLGWKVIERDISLQEVLDDAEEAFFTGTAAVLVPVTGIRAHGKQHTFPSTEKATALKAQLQRIQTQQDDDPFGWVYEVRGVD